jgi:hypothetical protein
MRWAWLVPALLSLVGFSTWGGEPELGLGSRPLARGGSCVAWADEATAGTCNPAGPAMLEGAHLLAGLVPPMRLWLLAGAARFGSLALSGSLTIGSNYPKDGHRDAEPEELWTGSLALRARERLSLGVGMKRYRRSSAGEETALDLGVLYRMAPLSLGVNFGNVVRGGEPLLAPRTRLGARLDISWLSGAAELLLSPTEPLQGRVGVECLLLSPLILRLGYGDGRLSGGLGFDSGTLKADFALVAADTRKTGTGEGPVWMLSTEVVFRG